MNKERLITLADYLETVPSARFNMNTWGTDPECGTAGCAMGHACQIPEFSATGLRLIEKGDGDYIPEFGRHAEYMAAAAFFDLEYMQAISLFSPDCYRAARPRPTTVARRIRRLAEASR